MQTEAANLKLKQPTEEVSQDRGLQDVNLKKQ
jgi:hypothetical protein